MGARTEYTPGTFCWEELATTDGNAAKKFYGDVFGWSANDQPVDENMVYTMLQKSGKDVAALFQMPPDMTSQGIPPNWLSYVSVTSVDETAGKAQKLGGTILREPMDVFDVGRMAVVQDPTGAVFALWQPNAHKGAALVNEPNTPCWNELFTTNADQAGKFYTELFGWGSETADVGSGTYTNFLNGDRPAGGMMQIAKEWGDVPPHWAVYFAVADCDATVKKATSAGAKVLSPVQDIPDIGRFAMLMDPQGAAFAVIALLNPQD